MKTKTYKKEEIIDYLLGSLPEAEAEFFDELSFTDDDFADELKATEKDLIDSYVNRELSGKKLELFENYYLASPLRREKVEFAKSFQPFAAVKITEFQSEIPLEKEEQKKFTISKFLNFPRLSMQWGFAFATVLLLFFGGWLLWQNANLRDELSKDQTNRENILKREAELAEREKQLQEMVSGQQNTNLENEKELAKIREEREKLAQEIKEKNRQERLNNRRNIAQEKKTTPESKKQPVIASFILSPSMRGNNQLKTLTLAKNLSSVNFKLELESDDFEFYRVALKNPNDGKILWQSGKLKADKSASLNANPPAKLLSSQIYFFEVSGITSDGNAEIISNYSFRVVR